MKKNMFYILITIMLVLCSCGGRFEIKNSSHSDAISKNIIKYFNDKDVDGLVSVFSPYVQEMEDLKEEIEDAFEYVDGKIISYNSVYYGSDGSIRDGKWVIKNDETEIREIITDNNKKYIIKFTEYIVYKEDKTQEGVYFIQLRDEEYNVLQNIGDYIE